MSNENLQHEKTDKQMTSSRTPRANKTTTMIFAGVWALIFLAATIARLDHSGLWQDLVVLGVTVVSAVSFLIVFVLFYKGKHNTAKNLSLITYSLQISSSVLQGGGTSIAVILGTSIAFVMMYAFLVEARATRNRYIFGGLIGVAILVIVNQIPIPFRVISTGTEGGGGIGLQFSAAIGITAAILILTQLRQGIRLFRRSTGFKLGVGFAVTTLVTIGFMVFAINVLTTVSIDFDYVRYADNEQIYSSTLLAEVRDMEVHIYEYLLNYESEGVDVAYNRYISEFESHYLASTEILDQLNSLLEEGWGDYKPEQIDNQSVEVLGTIQTNLETIDGLKNELVALVNQSSLNDTNSSIFDTQIAAVEDEINRNFQLVDPLLIEFAGEAADEVEVAQARLVQTSNRVEQTAIAFGIGALVVAGLSAFLTTRVIVRPIVSLTATANQLAEGQIEVRSDVKTQDESGTLAEVFNQMADRLQNTLEGLEATVAERTAELEERAKEMEASQRVTFAASERTTPDDFLELLVNLLVDQFDVYHAQVYLVDDDRKNAVLSQSTGYAGRVLLQRQHHIPLERESLVTRSINSGESVLVANTLEEAGWLANELLPHTQSELVVPLKVEGRVIGALDIQDRVAGRFTDATVPVFESMTEQVAFLYQNNELLEEIEASRADQERFAKQLATAAFISNQLGAILDLDQLLSQAVTMLQSQFNLYHAHIYLLDEAEENLVVQAGSGHVGVILKDRGHSISVDAEQSLVAKTFQNHMPTLEADVTQAENFMPNPLLPDTRSELAVPLVSRGRAIGVLDIQDENVGRFTDVDANTMNTLAVQLATAIENAQLFNQTAEERERFEALITYAPDAILMLDYETYKWTDANRNAETMFGMSRADLLKIGPGELSPSHQPDGRESGEKAVEMIMNAVAGGDSQFEWVHTNAAGEEFNCEIRLALLPGEEKQLLVNITDITDRKQAQDAIIEGDKLKSEFLANMSHELRTPLNSIVGYTDVLLMGVDGELNDEMLLDVQAIQENSALLLGIINDILDLAKIEAKRVIFEVSEVDVKDVLDNVVRNNAGLLVNKPVEMKVDAASNLPKMEVDPMRVEQVLNNLVSNAAKFTKEGHITLRAFKEKDMMVMQVEDTGLGINEDDLQTIFEEFRQADGSQTRTVEGTGLGLTITRRLVHMHSGTIEVESEVGKGSTFTVRLPLEANISPEVTVKKVEKKDVKPAKKAAAPKAEKPAPKQEAKVENGKPKAKGNGTKSLEKAAELFADELKEAVAATDASTPDDSKNSSKKESAKGKNGSKSK